MRTAHRRTDARTITLACSIGALSLLGAPAGTPVAPEAIAAPQPKPVPSRWEFRIDVGPLRTMVVDTDEQGRRAFYYFTFDVTNTTDQDRPLAPLFELVTDQGDVFRSGVDVPSDVPAKIIDRLGDPLLESEIDIQGILPQGREHARSGVIVWPVTDIQIDEVALFAVGFSGETVAITRPDTGEEVVLRKTLMLRHAIPGELQVTSDKPLERTMERWVMR